MRKMSLLKQLYCCYLSKPASDRKLYRAVAQFEINSVVEIGIASIERTCRVLELAHRFSKGTVQYTGIDLFESEIGASNKIGLKVSHVELKATGAKVKLMPGDPFSCLSRSVNLLSGTDLLIIGGNVDEDSMARCWFYLPRLIHEDSLVLIETKDGDRLTIEESNYDAVMKRADESLNLSNSSSSSRRAA